MMDIPRLSVAAIDVGFDVRAHNMPVIYPEWAGDGPVVLEWTQAESGEKMTRLCDSRAQAVRILRRHGYRVRMSADK